CQWTDEELEQHLPGRVKRLIANNGIKFYTIDGIKIGKQIGLGGRINTVLQSAFFKLAKILPEEDAIRYMKDAATASYSKKGEAIVKMNHDAIDAGAQGIHEVVVPESWKTAPDSAPAPKATGSRQDLVDFVNDIVVPVNNQMGDTLPVSTFMGDRTDGTFPQGTAAYEKRGVAVDVPSWVSENCIQCGFCSMVCPHAVIRPYAVTEEEAATLPEGQLTLPMTGMPGMKFAIGISVLDCTGCGVCVSTCPGKKGEKALVMKSLDSQMDKQEGFQKLFDLPEKPEVLEKFKPSTVKGAQFKQPLLEFSGACAGCGETPYAKLVTQICGDRMYIANATGCSSIWGGSAPATPYTVNKNGFGPAWANSLFEDNAEYGLGMFLAQDTIRQRLVTLTKELIEISYCDADLKAAAQNWLDTLDCGVANADATAAYVKELQESVVDGCPCDACTKGREILLKKDYLSKKSIWIFGGDGWAYDIGFGGLDHVIASHQDVNILVFDTEVYSNTGGQSSKSTPTGAIAQFAAAGKEVKKKDLAAIAMSYGYVYTAQVSMGADRGQCLKALVEAESYHGPSLVIAYAPCINHGIKGGLVHAQEEEKKAVDAGYWHLFRFDPRLAEEGKNPFQLDSKAPTMSYEDFIMNEVRYNALARSNPERAKELFAFAAATAKAKYEALAAKAGK
ncbi:MAG: thiamine pyrophosphate-dependent enzyme, partial [Oscillospiraceae bacterium]|nr:thiamine pyrophosphate-dependent enzyme [Oscillospiraceae bacterium]